MTRLHAEQSRIEGWSVKDPGALVRSMPLDQLRDALLKAHYEVPGAERWPTLYADKGHATVGSQIRNASRGQLWTYAAEGLFTKLGNGRTVEPQRDRTERRDRRKGTAMAGYKKRSLKGLRRGKKKSAKKRASRRDWKGHPILHKKAARKGWRASAKKGWKPKRSSSKRKRSKRDASERDWKGHPALHAAAASKGWKGHAPSGWKPKRPTFKGLFEAGGRQVAAARKRTGKRTASKRRDASERDWKGHPRLHAKAAAKGWRKSAKKGWKPKRDWHGNSAGHAAAASKGWKGHAPSGWKPKRPTYKGLFEAGGRHLAASRKKKRRSSARRRRDY